MLHSGKIAHGAEAELVASEPWWAQLEWVEGLEWIPSMAVALLLADS